MVGNGEDINIWEDNWVFYQNGHRILTPHINQNVDKVCDLIATTPKSWNTTVINQNFMPFESSLIHQIPLINETVMDQLMWPHSREGNYTVKSGYNLLKLWQESTNPNSSNYNRQNNIWKKLWNLPTIPRHKMLLWRILQRALPVRSELNQRGVPCNILCPRCLLKEETIEHVFVQCQHADMIWFGSKLGIKFDHNHTNFPEWLIYAMNVLNKEDLTYMAAVIYGIWYARNQKNFEHKDIEDYVTLEKASTSIQEYQQAMNTNNNNQRITTNSRSSNQHRRFRTSNSRRWIKPSSGKIKVNSDANLAVDDWWGLGATFRDSDGALLAAATWTIPGAKDPTLAEAYAVYLAMTMAKDCCFHEVEFECDNERVVTQINALEGNPKTYLGNIVWGIKCMKNHFRSCNIRHINRQANRASHCMAVLAHNESNKVWIEETPPQLVNVLIRDLIY
jgi:hypothetical protein